MALPRQAGDVLRVRVSPRGWAVNSGTSALNLIFAALDLPEGTEIAIPTVDFVPAATAAGAAGLVPRFVLVDRSRGMDPTALPDGDPPDAVLAVHPYGVACDHAAVADWAGWHGVVLLEDVAQGLGAYLGAAVDTWATQRPSASRRSNCSAPAKAAWW